MKICKCLSCGKEYDVKPDVCSVCGKKTFEKNKGYFHLFLINQNNNKKVVFFKTTDFTRNLAKTLGDGYEYVDRLQFKIEYSIDKYYIKEGDCPRYSTNVNGTQISKTDPIELKEGDLITVGKFNMKVKLEKKK